MFDDSDAVQEIVRAVPISKGGLHSQFDTVIVLDTNEAESTAVQGNPYF